MSNYNEYGNQNFNPDNTFMNNMVKENFINMASSIDLDNLGGGNLNGTSIMDLNKENFNTPINMPSFNMPNNLPNNLPNNIPFNNTPIMNNIEPMNNINPIGQDKHLIKSITRELINNLKENNISLHDEKTTHQSNNKKSNKYSDDEPNNYDSSNTHDDYEHYETSNKENKSKKSKKIYKYKDEIKKGVEHMLSENGVPSSENVSSYIFDDLFNLKDFIILFGVYFLLSQEMIKDLFAQYFTSLNPDDTGRVHVKGVIIYGLILTVLFMVLRKVI